MRDELHPDDRGIVEGLLESHTPEQLAEALVTRCGCTFDHRLPDDAPPVAECDYHRQKREAWEARGRLIDQMLAVKNDWERELLAVCTALGIDLPVGYAGVSEWVAAQTAQLATARNQLDTAREVITRLQDERDRAYAELERDRAARHDR